MKSNMRKILAVLGLALAFTACSKKEEASKENTQEVAVADDKKLAGGKITNDTTTPIPDVEKGGKQPTSLPEFEATDQDGKPFNRDNFKENEATIVNLWFTGCSACISEMPGFNDLADKYKKDGVGFVSMCTDALYDDSTKEASERIIKENKANYKALAVKYEGAMKDYLDTIFAYPTTLVVDKSGNIIGEPVVGALEDKAQLDQLDKLVEQAKASSKN